MTRLVGLACPFDQPARCWHPRYGSFEKVMRRGAFARTLSSVPILVNHSFDDVVSETCELWETDAGLFVRFDMQACCVRRLIVSGETCGLSVSFPFEEVAADWRGHRQIVYSVTYIREISIAWRRQPVFAGTWVRQEREAV
jgi:HK97 family phage prohead protease